MTYKQMKIIYGLSGEGKGHAAVANEVISLLIKEGHEVKVVTYGKSYEFLKKYSPLKIEGITQYYSKKNKLSLIKTIFKNLNFLFFYFNGWKDVRKKIEEFSPDLFILSFEPLTLKLARSLGKPSISITNQRALLYLKNKIPFGHKISFLVSKIATKLATNGADYHIILSFDSLKSKEKNVFFVLPIIQEEIRNLKAREGSKVLVYLKKPNPRLIEILKNVDETFLVYGSEINKQEKNLFYKKSGDSFINDLRDCKAIIATTGLSLIAEAIYLKKPFFGVPPKNEFEQRLNAEFLKERGIGDFSEEPSKKEFNAFFNKLQTYRKELKKLNFHGDEAKKVLFKLISKIEKT